MAPQYQNFKNTSTAPILYQYPYIVTQYQNPKIPICIDILMQSFDSQTTKLNNSGEVGDPFLVGVRYTYLTNRIFLTEFTIVLTNPIRVTRMY